MVDAATYLVTRDIAERSGMIATRYRTKDGRFILNDRDLSHVRFSSEEYITGLQGVEQITDAKASKLIKANGYQMGLPQENVVSAENTEQEEENTNLNEE